MKNIIYLFIALSAINFSCRKDKQPEPITLTDGLSYLPLPDSAWWLYGGDNLSGWYLTRTDSNIDGHIYRKTMVTNDDYDRMFFNTRDGVTYLYINSPFQGSGLNLSLQAPILKENLKSDQEWSFTTNTLGYDIKYTLRLAEKLPAMTIQGKTYSDCIRITQKGIGTATGSATIIVSDQDIWFAKGIGVIQIRQNQVGGTSKTQYLVDYKLNP